MSLCPNAFRHWAGFMAVIAAGLTASLAVAQESEMTPSGQVPDQVASSPEVVIVTVPHHGPVRSSIGAPIQDLSLSANVRTDDLNLQSPDGWLELRSRVRQTARGLCAHLRFQHPIGTPDEFGCVRRAVDNASDQIDASLRNGALATQNP